MLKSITNWFSGLQQAGGEHDAEANLHLAAAILMFEVARSDQNLGGDELERIEQLLRERWLLDDQALGDLLQVADRESDLSASLHTQIESINQAFSQDQKYRLLLDLWRIAHADGRIHHHEEHLVRRIADLLYLSHNDFIRSRLQVAGE